MSKPNIPINVYFQGCNNPKLEEKIASCKKKCYEYNKICPTEKDQLNNILKDIIGNLGKEVYVTPPFWCDYGYNITFGDYFYSNHNLIITDGAKVEFGSNVFVAPNCCFTTAEHAIDHEQRRNGIEVAKPIKVGNNVWIGAGATILAGVTIGDNSVIGAGSVVRKDIPSNVIAVGVPCKVIKNITEEDKNRYPFYKGEY